MCSGSRLRHKALNSQGSSFYDALGFPAQSLANCQVFFSPLWPQCGRVATGGGRGPVVAHELRCSEMPNVYCNRRWRHVRSSCNLLPVELVGPVKQRVHLSEENLHIQSQSLSGTEPGLENLCN